MVMPSVQLLFEPWEIGAHKAKKLLFTGGALGAAEAHRHGS